MSEMQLDAIWNRARADLMLKTRQGESDLFLWEHAVRVAQSSQHISNIPVVREKNADETAVLIAALYHDAGWVVRWQNGHIDRTEIRLGQLNEADRELGVALMEDRLASLIGPGSLQRAGHAIRTRSRRNPDSIEAQILCEAINLNGFGYMPLWLSIRRGMLEGKGVQAVIDTWKRKKEYHFWSARLHDSFRFEPVRKLAADRLKLFERFMEELEVQHTGVDLMDRLVQKHTDRLNAAPVY